MSGKGPRDESPTGKEYSMETGPLNGNGNGNGNGNFRPSLNDTLINGGDRNNLLQRVRTAGSISISPELFEKLYLTPENKVKGELRRTFGNPTPLALLGFVMSLTPLAIDLMGWRGAGGGGAASVGGFYFVGGLMMTIGGIFEFFLGNTFPFVVFTSFGGFWFAYGATLTPAFGAAAAYATATTAGAATTGYNATFGFYLMSWAMLVFIYLICSLRTNAVFIVVFLSLEIAFDLLTAGYFAYANGNAALGGKLVIGGGACAFVCAMAGWYIFLAQMLAALDFPIQIPVGDVSNMIPSATSRAAAKERSNHEA